MYQNFDLVHLLLLITGGRYITDRVVEMVNVRGQAYAPWGASAVLCGRCGSEVEVGTEGVDVFFEGAATGVGNSFSRKRTYNLQI